MDMSGYSWHKNGHYCWWLVNYEGKIVGNVGNLGNGTFNSKYVVYGQEVSGAFISEEQARTWLLKEAKRHTL